MRPLAKSLHTVSVLVNVARHLAVAEGCPSTPWAFVPEALAVLGYTGADDPHGITSKARAILEKGAA